MIKYVSSFYFGMFFGYAMGKNAGIRIGQQTYTNNNDIISENQKNQKKLKKYKDVYGELEFQ